MRVFAVHESEFFGRKYRFEQQKRLRIKCRRNLFALLLIEEFPHQSDMLFWHLVDGVAVGAVEVDEPVFCDDFSGLRLDKL